MKKRTLFIIMGLMVSLSLLAGCNNASEVAVEEEIPVVEENVEVEAVEETEAVEEDTNIEAPAKCELEDGIYLADFNTDSTMFHVNEMCDGKGELTVEDGKMTIHISLPSQSILNLYSGLADDAQKEGAELLQPTVDVIDYNDGTTEEVHGFDIPVPYLDDEFDVALVGTKGTWYDHKVSVSNPVLKEDDAETEETEDSENALKGDLKLELELEGGSGKASITSPATVKETDDGYILVAEWSSPNYDYMIVNGDKYLPVNETGNSVFEIPVESLDSSVDVIADTVAMSKPHEIEYTIKFVADSLKEIN